MIPQRATSTPTLHSTPAPPQTFRVEMNSMLFHTLMDGIYSDKIGSPIRELATNAKDAAPNIPFDVHLPTAIDPTFWVRDYGVSLTHEQVMSLYTTMFASSKRDSNDQTGMIGLGSKSPFAYTDTFTTTCYLNGEARVYHCFLNTDRVPQVTLISTMSTTEPPGVKVQFPVNPEDISSFYSKATQNLMGFDPLPNVVNPDFHFPDMTPSFSGPDYRVIPAALSGFNIRQGGVIYPLDLRKLPSDQNPFGWTYHTEKAGLLIDFAIGDIEVTSSREAIAYTPQTISNICNKLKEVYEHLSTSVQEQVQNAPTRIAACCYVEQLNSSFQSLLRSLRYGHDLKWNGQYLFHHPTDPSELGMRFNSSYFPTSYQPGRSSRSEKSIPASELRDAVFLKGRDVWKVRRVIEEGLIPPNKTVYWRTEFTQFDPTEYGCEVIDLTTIKPWPRPRTSRSPLTRREGFRMPFYERGQQYTETFVPDDTTLFTDPGDYQVGLSQLAGLQDRRVVILTPDLKTRLEKKKVPMPSYMEAVVKALNAKKIVVINPEKATYFLSHQLRSLALHLRDKPLTRKGTSLLKLCQKWVEYEARTINLAHYTLKELGVTFTDLSQQWDKDFPDNALAQLPLWHLSMTDAEQVHYLKLEGILK